MHHQILSLTDLESGKLIQKYLSNRKQRIKVINMYSLWKEMFYGIELRSQSLVHLFSIYFCVPHFLDQKSRENTSKKGKQLRKHL